jgi:KDO2-lipid IV(A) lauroyltransferase
LQKRSPVRNLLEYAAVRVMVASLEWTPLPLAGWLSRRYAALLDRAAPKLRKTARLNLEFALPEADREAIIDAVFHSIARILLAVSRFPRINKNNVDQWIRYEGFEHFEQALGRGKGVLFATAHLGNWELSAFAHALMTAPMHVVARPLDNPYLDAFVERRRRLSGNTIIGKKDLARGILKALSQNQAVGILVDQNTTESEGVFVDFFGIKACALAGFAKIAAHTGATVIPGFALWSEDERRFVLRFYPPLEITGDVQADTQRLQSKLEEVIREHPDQWLWIHRRWKTRPAGEGSLY